MLFAIKFDSLEKREAFCEFCEYLGWGFGMLTGAENGWWVDTSDENDNDEQMNYLHSLGAFQWYHE